MKRTYRLCKYAVVFLTVVFFLIGCYAKENLVHRNPSPHQEGSTGGVSRENVNKFLSSVRKIDGDAEAKYRMARYFQKKNRHKIAIEELKEILLIDPTFVKAYNAMGISYDKLRKYGRAIDCYRLALKIDPNLDYAHNNLGYSYLLSDNLDAAIESFQKAIQLNDQKKRYRNNLALVYVMKERYDLAIDQLKDLEGGPHAGETVAKLAHKLGKKDFENQIVRVLQKMKFEKDLNRAEKPVSGKSAIIQGKTEKQEIESGVRGPVVISGKIERASDEKNNSDLSENDGHKNTWKAWEDMCANIGESAENNPAISVKDTGTTLPPKSTGNPAVAGLNKHSKVEKTKRAARSKEIKSEKPDKYIVELEIANGTSVNGLAGSVRDILRENGFKVVKITNANSSDHISTKILYYNGHRQTVDRIINKIACHPDERNIIELNNIGNRIKIIVGKDLFQRS